MTEYRIHEIFRSIQGEGFNFGKEFVFVRFTGCNFDCSWCDQPTKTNIRMQEDELVAEILSYGAKSVLFTGGEPCLQLKQSLVDKLKNLGFYLAMETNGSLLPPEGIDYITTSPKTGRETVIKRASEVRIPVDSSDIQNYMEIKDRIKSDRYYLSPVYIESEDRFDLESLAQVYSCLKEQGFLISLQLHKLMGVR